MAEKATEKYIREAPVRPPSNAEITAPIPFLMSDGSFGDEGFNIYYEAIEVPFALNDAPPHQHPFPQYLTFLGGDITNMPDLGGEVEMTLSEDGKKLDKYTFTKATQIYIPAGLWHCPLIFTKVTKPILFVDIFFAAKYRKTVKA